MKGDKPLVKESLTKDKMKEEEPQDEKIKEAESEEEPEKSNPKGKRAIGQDEEGKSWLLCAKHNIWIGPDHPLY